MKTCTKCLSEKPLDAFSPQAKGKNGLCAICRACNSARGKEWHKNNRERSIANKREYMDSNRDSFSAYQKEWRAKNAESNKLKAAAWTAANLGVKAAATARRRAAKLRATPKWADQQAISYVYQYAKQLEEQAGIAAQVDHIVPLQSKLVCGLHCQANLVVLTEAANKRKGNKRWPDMP